MRFHPYVFQIMLITVFAYSYDQELVNYSLLIIYGGGVTVLYIIFLIFNNINEYRLGCFFLFSKKTKSRKDLFIKIIISILTLFTLVLCYIIYIRIISLIFLFSFSCGSLLTKYKILNFFWSYVTHLWLF